MSSKLSVVRAPSPLEASVGDYLAHVRAGGPSQKTRKFYEAVLYRQFLPWCQEVGVSSVEDLTQAALDRFSEHLQVTPRPDGAPRSKHTVASYARTLGFFVTWLREAGEVGAKVRMQRPKTGRALPRVLSRAEIQSLEDAATCERDKLLVRLLADTGLRASELLNLRDEDLLKKGTARFLRVVGKGDQVREVPLRPALFDRLWRFSARSRPNRGLSSRIWWSRARRPDGFQTNEAIDGYDPLHVSGLDQLFRQLCNSVGLVDSAGKARAYPHLLRHSYATWALSRGVPTQQVADVLGHSSLAMISQTYAHLTPQMNYDSLMRLLQEHD